MRTRDVPLCVSGLYCACPSLSHIVHKHFQICGERRGTVACGIDVGGLTGLDSLENSFHTSRMVSHRQLWQERGGGGRVQSSGVGVDGGEIVAGGSWWRTSS
eukprot:6466794-Amphidinium_carterae.4